jgi:hypothetical protein
LIQGGAIDHYAPLRGGKGATWCDSGCYGLVIASNEKCAASIAPYRLMR